ncbi:MAG: PDDEXK nuclease domain-containing protein [Endozoicomonas sp.]|uniref:PDDEXK nuclease domain-containing protein n=1 Tax=Endozoicomonas sp. TaxID=1892382 RepID=UPI003D9BED5A
MSESQHDKLLNSIRELLTQGRQRVVTTVNAAMVQTYWEIGRLIVEDEQQGERRATYGKEVLKKLSDTLSREFDRGFSVRNLRNMRAFFLAFPIRQTLSAELSWSHYSKLITIENASARQWYMKEATEQSWSVRALERQMGTLYYERLLATQQGKQDLRPVLDEADKETTALAVRPEDYLRDPYILDFLNLPAGPLLENELESALINNLQKFLLELGKGFAFVERQQRISTDDGDYFIDLVFYNFHLKCFLLIDLKMNKLTHQDVGQMDMYVRMYEEKKRRQDDNPTIGLILCSQGNHTVAKYSVLNDSQQLFASKYKLELPSEEELRLQLEQQRQLLSQKTKEEGR